MMPYNNLKIAIICAFICAFPFGVTAQEEFEFKGRNIDDARTFAAENESFVSRTIYKRSSQPVGTVLNATALEDGGERSLQVVVSAGIEVPNLLGKTVNGAIAELVLNDLDYEAIVDEACAEEKRRVVGQHPPAFAIVDATETKVIFVTQGTVEVPTIPITPSKTPNAVVELLKAGGQLANTKLNFAKPVYGACAYATDYIEAYVELDPESGTQICDGEPVTVLYNRYPVGIVNEAKCDKFGNCICP